LARARVRAYSSSANLGPGFDILALAHTAFYDEVEVEVEKGVGRVVLEEVSGPYASQVDTERNTAVEALRAAIEALKLGVDVRVRLWKGVPVGKGLGSSGASAAAAVKALDEALRLGLDPRLLIRFAGMGEAAAAGEPHFDNVAASIVGGFVALLDLETLSFTSWSPRVLVVIAVPRPGLGKGKTEFMRSVVPREVPLRSVVRNCARLLRLVIGLERGDVALVGSGMEDEIVERARAPYVPCYAEARSAAKSAGALGVALSGAGPSIIALCDSEERAREVAKAFREAYEGCGIELEHLVVAKPAPGAHRVD